MDSFLENIIYNDDDVRIKGIIESILFVSGDPVAFKDLAFVIGVQEQRIKNIVSDMMREYESQSRGIYLIEFNGKVQLATKPEYGDYIKKLIKPDSRQNLSQAALETLSIIAYRQPITKIQIEEIRGVRSDRPISTLLENGLIKESGRLETTGRPLLYVTTDDFLKYFGFKNINELPELIEFNIKNEEE